MLEHLPSLCKTLDLIFSTTHKKEKTHVITREIHVPTSLCYLHLEGMHEQNQNKAKQNCNTLYAMFL